MDSATNAICLPRLLRTSPVLFSQVITHKECANHITPGSFGQSDMLHVGAATQQLRAENWELAATEMDIEAEEPMIVIHSVPEQVPNLDCCHW